jgi:hypothetical protein
MAADDANAGAQPQAAAQPVTAPPAPTPLQVNTRQFTVDRKAYDPLVRPFHRLNARTYDTQVDVGPTPSKIGPDGKGRDCGCRNRSDFKSSVLTGAIVGAFIDGLDSAINKAIPGSRDLRQALEKALLGKDTDLKKSLTDFLSKLFEGGLFGGFLKNIPSWVPVNRKGFGPDFDAKDAHNVVDNTEAEIEIEGTLTRSYQTHHHRPYTQWSRYYHWAFHVVPAVGFKHLVRRGQLKSDADKSLEADTSTKQFSEAINIYDFDPGKGDGILDTQADFECMLDIGAFTIPPGDRGQPLVHPGIFYDQSWPFWPMHGDYFWAAGRYVYDCTHVTTVKEKDQEKPDQPETEVDLHPALMNPVKAFATARYEATLFDESDEPLPCTRFSFFSCRKGGYWDFDADKHLPFGNVDYEFAIDLPPAPSGDVSYDIGPLGDFALNTLVIRPRLLQKIEFAPHKAGGESPLRWHTEQPKVEIVKPADGSLPRMVKLTVPMSTVPKNVDGYGFTISFAWLAPGVPTGVKKVSVKLDKMIFQKERDDLRMTIAVNGRMVFVSTKNLSSKNLLNPSDSLQGFPGNAPIVLFLPPEKFVRISAHGSHVRGFGEFLEDHVLVDPAQPEDDPKNRTKDRRLAVGGVFNVSPDVEKFLKEAAEKKLGEQIPKQLQGNLKKFIDTLDNEDFRKLLKSAVGDLVGQRRIVVWDKDVDFQETDAAKKDEIACAVAREMSIFPFDFANFNNGPMGFVEFGNASTGGFDNRSAATFPGDQSRLNVQAMSDRLKSTGSAVTTVDFFARPVTQVEEEEFAVVQLNPGDTDYQLTVSVTIADPDPPK